MVSDTTAEAGRVGGRRGARQEREGRKREETGRERREEVREGRKSEKGGRVRREEAWRVERATCDQRGGCHCRGLLKRLGLRV